MLSYNGVTFASLNVGAGIPDMAWSGPQNQALTNDRTGANPVYVGLRRGPKTLTAELTVKPGFDAEATLLTALAMLDPEDATERLLVGLLNDGTTTVQVYAAIVGYGGSNGNSMSVDFSIANAKWQEAAPTVTGPNTWPFTGGAIMETPNLGKARAPLSLVLKPTAYDPGTVGFKWRRQFTLTNNSDTPLRQFPYEIDLGNSNGWGNTVSANQSKTWVFRDGLQVPRTLIGWSEIQSYMWILIDDLAPGATATYDIAWEGINDATGLVGNRQPAFDISWEKNNATSGGASTITKSSATWRTDQWARGKIHILSGLGSGQNRYILSNSATVITTVSAWTTNPDATSVFLLTMSHNDRWIYDVRQTSRSNPNRGLWYQNKGQSKPSNIVFDTPGAWYRTLVIDNNDEKANSRTFPIDVGGGDIDYFNGLDAQRTVQGWSHFQESGQADGVAFSSPIEIDGFRFDVALKNPNGIGRAIVGYRESGSEDWEEAYADSAAHATLVASAVQDVSFTTDIRHLVAYLAPLDSEVMPTTLIKDTGSRTGGGATTLQDDSKEWQTDQWANGYVKITAGTGLGQTRVVGGNSSVNLTGLTTWTTTPSDDSRFEVRNKKLICQLRHNQIWEVRLNTSKISQSAIGSQITNYSMIDAFTFGGGPDAGIGSGAEGFPYQLFTLGGGSRALHVGSTEELRIDGARRRAGVYRTSDGAFVRDVTTAISVRDILAYDAVLGTYTSLLAPEWLVVPPNPTTNPIVNPAMTGNITGWSKSGLSNDAGTTNTGAYDATIFRTLAGSLKVDITASTAAAGAYIVYGVTGSPPYVPVTPNRSYTFIGYARSSSLNWKGKLGISWYNAAGTLLSTVIPGPAALGYQQSANLFWQIGVTATAPPTAFTARPLMIAWEVTGSTTGSVYFDDLTWDSSALYYGLQSAGNTMSVTASLTEGVLG